MGIQLANPKPSYKFLNADLASLVNPDNNLVSLNEEICRLFEETMSDGIIAVNETGIILSINENASEIFGYSAKEAIGKNISDLILLEYPDKLDRCNINFVKIKGEIKFLDRLCEISEKHQEESIIPVKFSVGKTHLDDRLLISITVQHIEREKLSSHREDLLIKNLIEMDQLLGTKTVELGEYKNLLQKEVDKRKKAEDKLRLSQAMSSMDARFIKAGRVAEQIAHDFNNLLVPLQTFPKLLKRKLQEDSESLEYCTTIEKVAHRLMQTNDQILTLMAFNYQEPLAFDVNMILTEALNLVNGYFTDDFTIIANVSKEKYMVKGRPEQLYRVFFNLLLNVKDATIEKKGKIIVNCEKIEVVPAGTQEDQIFSSEYAKITISDDGPGMPKEILDKIFDPCYTTKNEAGGKGAGLGLTVVKDTIREHNGFIEVDSIVGEGTIFSIHLPILK